METSKSSYPQSERRDQSRVEYQSRRRGGGVGQG